MKAHERFPLSHAQEQLWFLDQLFPGQPVYNSPLALHIHGQIQVPLLHAALASVVHRHQALRASFPATDGVPVQVVAPPGPVGWTVEDLGDRDLGALLQDEAAKPFSLRQGPLYRFRLLRLGVDHVVLSMVFHHIIVDGASLSVICRDLAAAYRALSEGGELPAAREPHWGPWVRRHRLEADQPGVLKEALAHWEGRLKSLQTLELPADRFRASVTGAQRGGHVSRLLDADVAARLRALARAEHVSLFAVVAGAAAVLLSRYTGEDDIAFGVPLSERRDPDAEEIVGLLINMSVLRIDLSGDPTFTDLLAQVLDGLLDIHDLGWVPFPKLVERLRPARDPGRNPLFQVSVQLAPDPQAMADVRFPAATVEAFTPEIPQSRFDLAVNFFQTQDSIRFDLEYSAELFDAWRIHGLADHLAAILRAVAHHPELRRSQVPLLGPGEVTELIQAGLGVELEPPAEPLHARIAAVAARQGAATAAVCQGRTISYAELDRRAEDVAGYLLSTALRPGEIVGILMSKDLEALVALLGVLKAGCAFAMLDPDQPPARLSYLLRDTGARIVLSEERWLTSLQDSPACSPVLLDRDAEVFTEAATKRHSQREEYATGSSAAYVVYTSGSTGRPKGVVVEHSAMNCFVEGYLRVFPLGPGDRMLQFSALTFDLSQGEIFAALIAGATLVLVPDEVAHSPRQLSVLMRDERVTYAGLTPALLALLPPNPYPHLRYLMAGGDVLPADLVNKWNLPGRLMINMYGPSEAAVACAHHECERTEWTVSPPIGRPQPGRRLYVVDRWGNLTPRGVPGELLIGGSAGLARGYLGPAQVTAEKFIADTWRPGQRVYRSGDIVCWGSDFRLRFLGRKDNQVKLNGLRIELGEIESALLWHPLVDTAAVVARSRADGFPYLVGYVTSGRAHELTAEDLGRHVATFVPGYMVPAVWVILDTLPLNSSGKVDRKALAETSHPLELSSATTWTSATLQGVADILAAVLGRPGMPPGSGFFELGGTSFQAMRAVSHIEDTFGVQLSVRALYANPTVEAVAGEVERLRPVRCEERPGGEWA